MEHLSDCGLVTDKELLNIKKVNERSEFLKYVQWIPLSWASSLVVTAYEQVIFGPSWDQVGTNLGPVWDQVWDRCGERN